jgi:hypothetical protein
MDRWFKIHLIFRYLSRLKLTFRGMSGFNAAQMDGDWILDGSHLFQPIWRVVVRDRSLGTLFSLGRVPYPGSTFPSIIKMNCRGYEYVSVN